MKLPAGKYYIGDPCYVLASDDPDDKRWGNFCKELWKHGHSLEEFEDIPMFAAGTAYGDGSFEGSDGFWYGVDAGLIGIVPLSLCTDKKRLARAKKSELGRFVTFKKDILIDYLDGIFWFGDITINTKSQYAEDYDR